MIRVLFFAGSLFGFSSLASAQYINAYAVSDHRPCGSSNLPATIVELDKFFASPYFPQDAQQNIYYKNAAVNSSHWLAANDLFESAKAASGFDGSDAPLISYIASHGVTSNARYTASAGGGANGCDIRSSNMAAGDNNARYFILSTCQGLKIGTGSNPNSSGENPSITWRDANKGLNCIFGYSNNMIDGSNYGAYFLENLATTDETLAQAFMRASRRISSGNISAVLCFGADDAAAREHLETTKRFTSGRIGRGGSAWTYSRSKRVEGIHEIRALSDKQGVPRVVSAKIPTLSAEMVASSFLGQNVQDQTESSNLKVFRSSVGIATVNSEQGFFSFVKNGARVAKKMEIADEAAVRIAGAYLANKGFLGRRANELVASNVVDRYVGNESGSELVEKIVVMSQTVEGIAVLGSAGSIEVAVGGDGDVRSVTGSLVEMEPRRIAEWVDTKDIDVSMAEKQALTAVAEKVPGAKLSLIQTLVGFDTGDYADRAKDVRLVAEITVEAAEGKYARRYIERVGL